MKIGIVQGIGSPNVEAFADEAVQQGLKGVEVFVGSTEDAVLDWSDADREMRRAKAERDGIHIVSTATGAFNGDSCIIEREGRDKALAFIRNLLGLGKVLGSDLLMICTYLKSHPDTPEKKANFLDVVRTIEPEARSAGIRIALETPLSADEFKAFVEEADSDHVGVYYDTGNAVANGYDPVEEIHTLGEHIMSVHIKDSLNNVLGGLHLGEGDVDLAACMNALYVVNYQGWLMMETPGDDEEAIRKDIQVVREHLESFGLA